MIPRAGWRKFPRGRLSIFRNKRASKAPYPSGAVHKSEA
jgi:hypothetical protein